MSKLIKGQINQEKLNGLLKDNITCLVIPSEVICLQGMTPFEKQFLALLHSLRNVNGCYAKNKYFAEYFDVTERHIKDTLKELISLGLVQKIKKGRARFLKTSIDMSIKNLNDNNDISDVREPQFPLRGTTVPLRADLSLYNIINNKSGCVSCKKGKEESAKFKKELDELCKRVIDYLNKKCKKKFSYRESSIKKIKARRKEGFSEQDFYTVIDNKSKDPYFKENSMYLRPSTLFSENMEGYLNETKASPWG